VKLANLLEFENEIEKEVYIFICRHFLASISKDAEGIETLVKLKVDD
jgi:DNA topoisomerase IA